MSCLLFLLFFSVLVDNFLIGESAGTDNSVNYHISIVDMKDHRPTVVDDAHCFCVWVYPFGKCIRTFPVGSCGVCQCLNLPENAIDEVVPACRLVLAGDVFDNFVKVAYGFIAYYHPVT